MQSPVKYIKAFIGKGDTRTVNAKKNILALFLLRGLSIFVSFLIVPLTIDYLSAETYGVWLTLSSIILWFANFELGLPNGFRNRFTEAKSLGHHLLTKMYVSTTYCIMTAIFIPILLILLLCNELLDWSALLHLSASMRTELHDVFIVMSLFLSLKVIASVFSFMLLADQKPALSVMLQTSGQVISLIIIYILVHTSSVGSLLYLALTLSGIPCLVVIVASIIGFRTKTYRRYAPTFGTIRPRLVKNIIGKGIEFLLISLSVFFIFQFINIILSRELGSMSVTQYNISYKYFSVVYIVAELVVAPFWSRFTEAYAKNDFDWMAGMVRKLERLMLVGVPIVVLMVVAAHWVISFWVRDSVQVPFALNAIMGLFIFFQSAYCVYSNLVNGIGKIKLQLYTILFFACISIPGMTLTVRTFGLWGCMLMPTFTYFCLMMLCRFQIRHTVREGKKSLRA